MKRQLLFLALMITSSQVMPRWHGRHFGGYGPRYGFGFGFAPRYSSWGFNPYYTPYYYSPGPLEVVADTIGTVALADAVSNATARTNPTNSTQSTSSTEKELKAQIKGKIFAAEDKLADLETSLAALEEAGTDTKKIQSQSELVKAQRNEIKKLRERLGQI